MTLPIVRLRRAVVGISDVSKIYVKGHTNVPREDYRKPWDRDLVAPAPRDQFNPLVTLSFSHS